MSKVLPREWDDTEAFPHLEKPDKATSSVPLNSETVVLEVMGEEKQVIPLQTCSNFRQDHGTMEGLESGLESHAFLGIKREAIGKTGKYKNESTYGSKNSSISF